MKQSISLLLVMLLVSCGVFAQEEDRMERIAPEESFFVVSVDNYSKLKEAIEKNFVAEFLEGEEFKDFFAPLMKQMKDQIEGFELQSGVEVKKLLNSIGDEMFFAVSRHFPEEITGTLVIKIKDKEAYKTLETFVLPKLPNVAENKYNNQVYKKIGSACWSVVDDKFIFTTNEVGMKRAILRSQGPRKKCLLSNDRYMNALKKRKPTQDIMCYLDLVSMMALFAEEAELDAKQVMKFLGGYDVDSLAMYIDFTNKDKMIVSVAMPRALKSLLSVIKNTPETPINALNFLHADTSFVMSLNLDIKGLWKFAQDRMKEMNPQAFEAAMASMKQQEQMLGFNIENDLLNNLTGEITFHTPPGTFFSSVVSIGVKDEEGMKKALNSIERMLTLVLGFVPPEAQPRNRPALSFRSVKFKGQTIRRLDGGHPGFAFMPAYIIKDGFIKIGPTSALKEDILNDKSKLLKDNPKFQKAIASKPANTMFFAYGDFGKENLAMTDMIPFIGKAISAAVFEGSRGAVNVPISWDDFPPISMIKKYIQPSCCFVYTDQDTISIKSSGNMLPLNNSLQSVAMVSIIAAIAIPNLLENRKLANEQAAQALLTRILEAQFSYNTRNGRYAPSLEKLVESRFLQEDAFLYVKKDGDTAIIQGYVFTQIKWTETTWAVKAVPIDPNTGTRVFYVDSNGKVQAKPLGMEDFPKPKELTPQQKAEKEKLNKEKEEVEVVLENFAKAQYKHFLRNVAYADNIEALQLKDEVYKNLTKEKPADFKNYTISIISINELEFYLLAKPKDQSIKGIFIGPDGKVKPEYKLPWRLAPKNGFVQEKNIEEGDEENIDEENFEDF